jgi:hypothetical protein
LGIAFLLAAGSIGYHYAVYIPTRDNQLDNERRAEKAHAEFARKSAEERAQAEREAALQQAASSKAAIQASYNACIADAKGTLVANWSLNCKQIADRARKAKADCMKSTAISDPSFCERTYPPTDPRPIVPCPQALPTTLIPIWIKLASVVFKKQGWLGVTRLRAIRRLVEIGLRAKGK